MIEILELKKEDEKSWDEYVMRHPDSTFYHQVGWKNVVERSYGHKPYYLLANEDGKIRGILPLFYMKSLIFGRKLVSVPFAPYGGVIGDNINFKELLIQHAIKITNEEEANYLEMRTNLPQDSTFPSNNDYVTLILRLDKDPEKVWKGFNNKVRNAVRKGLNSELKISEGSVDDFYELYSRNIRDLGTPTHSKKFFDAAVSEFQKNIQIITVKQNTKAISSAILFHFKDIVISSWAASNKEYSKLNANNLLYWSAIKSACENGYNFFDFGRSIEGTGTYRFKQPWGAEPIKLYYRYYMNPPEKHLPNTSTLNTKRKLFSKIYKKLPLVVANLIGPRLRRNFA